MQLDSLAFELQRNPNYHGYIIVVGGENPVINFIYEQATKGRLEGYRIDPNSYSIITTKPNSNKTLKVETWISTNSTKPKIQDYKFSYALPTDKPTLFNRDMITVADIDGKTTYFGDCSICCLEAFNLGLLSKFLEANFENNCSFDYLQQNKKRCRQAEKTYLN
jgi:hypothetical protein